MVKRSSMACMRKFFSQFVLKCANKTFERWLDINLHITFLCNFFSPARYNGLLQPFVSITLRLNWFLWSFKYRYIRKLFENCAEEDCKCNPWVHFYAREYTNNNDNRANILVMFYCKKTKVISKAIECMTLWFFDGERKENIRLIGISLKGRINLRILIKDFILSICTIFFHGPFILLPK